MAKPILVCELPISTEDDYAERIRKRLDSLVAKEYHTIVYLSADVSSPVFRTNHPDLYSLEELKQIEDEVPEVPTDLDSK